MIRFDIELDDITASDRWEEYIELVRRVKNSKGFELRSLEKIKITPLPYQLETVRIVMNRLGIRAIIAEDVGLGKTIEAGIIIREIVDESARNILIIAPASLLYQWKVELLEKFDLSFDILKQDTRNKNFLIASYELAKSKNYYDVLVGREWDLVVVDEAHRLRNQQTKNYELVSSLKTRYILLLTATPIQNSLKDLYSLVSLVKPGLLGTLKSFEREFVADKKGLETKNVEALREILKEVMVRHRYSEVFPEISKRIANTFLVDMRDRAHEILKKIRKLMLNMSDSANKLKYIALERGMCSSRNALLKMLWNYLENTRDLEEKRVLLEIYGEAQKIYSDKIEMLKKILEKVENYAVVYANYIETTREIEDECRREGYRVFRFDGTLSKEERKRIIDSFKNYGGILVSTDAGSEGLNLQFCNFMVNYDLCWNPMKIEQRIGRIHRFGQIKDVLIFNLAYRNTIDERVIRIIDSKIRLFKRVVGEINVILGELYGRGNIESSVIKILLNARDEKDIEAGFATLEADIDKIIEDYEKTRIINDELMGGVISS